MRKIWFALITAVLSAAAAVHAQDTATPQPSVTVSDQLSLDGFITLERVVSPTAGWAVIYAGEEDGQYVVGIAPVVPGDNFNVRVMIDLLGAAPSLTARLHADDGQPGVFEFGEGSADSALAGVESEFDLTAIRVYQQMLVGSSATVASVITGGKGWMVIHADNNGQPGAVLGQTAVDEGVNPGVVVALAGDITPVLWAMLHTDDGAVGTYEFVPGGSADAPLFVNSIMANVPFVTASEPVILSTTGLPLPAQVTDTPSLTVSDQQPGGSSDAPTIIIGAAHSAGNGWLRVTADDDDHPAAPLGAADVPNGDSSGISVALDVSRDDLPDAVWATLHIDDNTAGENDYMRIVGADMPVVVNGRILAQKINLRSAATPGPIVTAAPTEEPTSEATVEPTGEATAQPTAEVTAPAQPTAEVTAPPQPPAEATEAAGGQDTTG